MPYSKVPITSDMQMMPEYMQMQHMPDAGGPRMSPEDEHEMIMRQQQQHHEMMMMQDPSMMGPTPPPGPDIPWYMNPWIVSGIAAAIIIIIIIIAVVMSRSKSAQRGFTYY